MNTNNENTKPPLSKPEIAAWLEIIGSNDTARINTLRQLIKYRRGDQMSQSDEAICRQELRKLELRHEQTSDNKDSSGKTKA